MSLHEGRFGEDAKNGRAVVEAQLAYREARGLLLQNPYEPSARYQPDLDGDAGSAEVVDPHHCGVVVVDGPKAICRFGGGFAEEGGTRFGHVGIKLEPAHERAIDRDKKR